MRCGGLNGCPTKILSGCLALVCITLGVMPDELDAIIESTGVASSMSANSLILKSTRSGPFSCTKSACESASFIFDVKPSRSRDAPGDNPISVSVGQASSTYLRRFASAFGAGSVAITSNPRARYCAAQLAPITPVPTIAIRRIGLLKDISAFLSGFVSWAGMIHRTRARAMDIPKGEPGFWLNRRGIWGLLSELPELVCSCRQGIRHSAVRHEIGLKRKLVLREEFRRS